MEKKCSAHTAAYGSVWIESPRKRMRTRSKQRIDRSYVHIIRAYKIIIKKSHVWRNFWQIVAPAHNSKVNELAWGGKRKFPRANDNAVTHRAHIFSYRYMSTYSDTDTATAVMCLVWKNNACCPSHKKIYHLKLSDRLWMKMPTHKQSPSQQLWHIHSHLFAWSKRTSKNI